MTWGGFYIFCGRDVRLTACEARTWGSSTLCESFSVDIEVIVEDDDRLRLEQRQTEDVTNLNLGGPDPRINRWRYMSRTALAINPGAAPPL